MMNKAVPILVSQAAIYPNGRIMPVIMKGIHPSQNIVNMPTHTLEKNKDINIPVLIGKGMANNTKLNIGTLLQFAGLILMVPMTQTRYSSPYYGY